jgi:MFS family permease
VSQPEAPREERILSRHNMLSLYLPAMILALGSGIALPALPVYARSFDVTFGVASLVVVASGLGSLVAGLPTGFLMDRIGRRKIILAGPIAAAVTSILVASAQSFPELLVYRFAGGVAQQMWMLGRLAVIADTSGAGQRGRQITGMHAMDSAGRIAGPLVGGLLAAAWDVRIPFIVHGVLCLISVIPSFKLLKETAPEAGRARAHGGLGIRAALRDWPSWLVTVPILTFLVAQFMGSVTRGALNGGSLHLYAVYAYDVDAVTIGFLATAATALSIPIMVGSGAVMDRFGRKATIVPGFSLLATTLVFVALTAHNAWPFSVYVVAFLAVVGANNITTGNMQTLSSDIAPAHARGSFFGLSQTVVQVGHVLSPIAFAVLTDNVSAASAFVFLGVCSLSVAILVGALVHDPVRARRQAQQREARIES